MIEGVFSMGRSRMYCCVVTANRKLGKGALPDI